MQLSLLRRAPQFRTETAGETSLGENLKSVQLTHERDEASSGFINEHDEILHQPTLLLVKEN
jgi:hypothetical protein